MEKYPREISKPLPVFSYKKFGTTAFNDLLKQCFALYLIFKKVFLNPSLYTLSLLLVQRTNFFKRGRGCFSDFVASEAHFF